jgi:predicted nucleotidyltransferase
VSAARAAQRQKSPVGGSRGSGAHATRDSLSRRSKDTNTRTTGAAIWAESTQARGASARGEVGHDFWSVESLEVFGSVARNEELPDSDIDLLYVLKPGTRLGFRLFDLEDELAALFGRPVDLVARQAVNKYIREQVLAEAQSLYAA